MTIPQVFQIAVQHHQAGRLADAEALYRQIIAVQPNHAEALHYLGVIAHQVGRNEMAVEWIRQAIALNPHSPDAHSNLGVACRAIGRLDEAIASFHRALELKPDLPEARINLGNAFRDQGELHEAISAFQGALELNPDYPDAHYNLGNALVERGRPDEAIAAYRRALELKPDFPEACINLGNALKDQGEMDAAIASFRHALELRPEHPRMHSNLIYALHFHPAHDERTIDEERQRWSRKFGEPLKQLILPHSNDPAVAGRKLRVGYVSPDFRDHVVGRNVLPLLERHDRRIFEILCYSDVVKPDQLTKEFRQCAHLWRSIVGVDDETVVEIIRKDGVDILVDLAQHTACNRLPVFARKPAPVQVSFAAYPGSTGLEAIEYRISDHYLESGPAQQTAREKEQVCLIDSFWCYESRGAEVEVNGLPARAGGRVTFGCLNNFCKVNERALRLWAQVLGKVKDSRLILLAALGSHRQRTWETLEKQGVEAQRVEFVEFRPRREYLQLHHRLDIVLDTFPYNGHTTSLDALWMGVPVITLAGNTSVSSAGVSQLTNLGMPELIARTETEFVNIAENLARDLPRLAQLRSTLRDRMQASILMDAPRFARQIEQAYRSMWRAWRLAQSPIPG